MQALSDFFRRVALALAVGVVLLAPWCFGAWEMWGFWPFAMALFAAVGCLGLGHLLSGLARRVDSGAPDAPPPRFTWAALASSLPFLLYAGWRLLHTPVYLECERSFLLFATPALLSLVLLSARPAARRLIFLLIAVDLAALGLYGVVNHLVCGSRYVLWVRGFDNYFLCDRATGSYFCPDHFAGVMELGLCIGLALAMRARGALLRVGGVGLIPLVLLAIVMSKSRGGVLVALVTAAAALAWGLGHVPREARPWWRVAGLTVMVAGALLIVWAAPAFTARFDQYFGLSEMRGKSLGAGVSHVAHVFVQQDRPRMAAGALRAWRSEPWIGIGGGMHPHLWPHFGPTPDGDRAQFRWPSAPNNAWVSNAVHNDWVQLLEEYGVIGFALFLIPVGFVCAGLARALRRHTRGRRPHPRDLEEAEAADLDAAAVLAAVLAVTAMAFHSFGDFNLQMPATVWLLTAIVTLALAQPERRA